MTFKQYLKIIFFAIAPILIFCTIVGFVAMLFDNMIVRYAFVVIAALLGGFPIHKWLEWLTRSGKIKLG